MNDNGHIKYANPSSEVQNVLTMVQIERDLPPEITAIDAIDALAHVVAQIASRIERDEAVMILGVGAMLIGMAKGSVVPEDIDAHWPMGMVEHVRGMMPSISDLTSMMDASGMGPDAAVPAAYVHLLLSRIESLQMSIKLIKAREVLKKAGVADLIEGATLAQPIGRA